ncbi:MAG: META domain-containing protein [Acidobacteriota bacterium]
MKYIPKLLLVTLLIIFHGFSNSLISANDQDNPNTEISTRLVGTEWELIKYGPPDHPLTPLAKTRITISFRADRTLQGSAGCNQYDGTYALTGQSIAISDLSITTMGCSQKILEQEDHFTQALNSATSLKLTGDMLIISYNGGEFHFKLVIPPANRPLIGTLWQLDGFETGQLVGQLVHSLFVGTKITGEFIDGTVRGTAGCNNYWAEYRVDGQKISIGEIKQTDKRCREKDVMKQEAEYLEALRNATRFTIEGNNLTLRHSAGALRFRANKPN